MKDMKNELRASNTSVSHIAMLLKKNGDTKS